MHLDFLAVGLEQPDLRTQALAGRLATALRINHHQRRKACDLIDLFGNGHAFLDILELHETRVLGDDRSRVRIPAGQPGTGLDGLTVSDLQCRAIGDFVLLTLATVVVGNQDLAGTGDDNLLSLGAGNVAHRRSEAHHTGTVRLDVARHGGA
ncbi:MAG: hypothetical protein AW09_001870 [Candidatus Accumulibacter phosphatis]|uniref:Uncharacterized protein n=1 Tax=Candidatus Accumulibacter phosphatis TaxID=327160 RepID=A0A080M711_9PROT|nr:MAG: hypothetical protein AW09_001870 [Candidatus Accumulibacter phosphatis]